MSEREVFFYERVEGKNCKYSVIYYKVIRVLLIKIKVGRNGD